MLRKTIKSIIIVFNHTDTQRFNAVLSGKKHEAVPTELRRDFTQSYTKKIKHCVLYLFGIQLRRFKVETTKRN